MMLFVTFGLAKDESYIEGLAITVKKHQLLAAYWMLLTESSGCPGGYESDEMGYGKVRCLY